ncbi:MAG: hypothetical protein WCR55_10955 [Lentisphaerota bacterium]
MKKQKANIDFTRVKDTELAQTARIIVANMSNNPNFSVPLPTLTVVHDATEDYYEALLKCSDGTKQDTAIKKVKRSVLSAHLAHLGNYVNYIAEGNIVKLDSSGFPLSKIPTPVGILNAPDYIKVIDGGNPGCVWVDIGIVRKATGYIVLFALCPAPEENKDWQSKLFSKSSGLMLGLQSGKKYAFKASATSTRANKINSYHFTQPVERFIQ